VGSTASASLLTQAALEVLNTACDSDTAFEQLPDQALGATLDIIARDAAQSVGPHRKSDESQRVLLAALRLAYSASMCSSAARSRLGAQLVKPVQGSSRLLGLWDVCCSKMGADGGAVSSVTSVREIRVSCLCCVAPSSVVQLASMLCTIRPLTPCQTTIAKTEYLSWHTASS
jgi:hypothetical protein